MDWRTVQIWQFKTFVSCVHTAAQCLLAVRNYSFQNLLKNWLDHSVPLSEFKIFAFVLLQHFIFVLDFIFYLAYYSSI